MRPAAGRGEVTTVDGATAPRPDKRSAIGAARAAGWAGLLFALLFAAALVLVRQEPGLTASDAEYEAFYARGSGVLVAVGMYIVPFAGVACLWHMTATRTLLQVLRPRSWSLVPHWLQLASGVVFVGLLFAGTGAVGAIALLAEFSAAPLPPPDVARALNAVGYSMVFVFGVRAAGMYMIATTTVARSVGLMPRWLALVSYLAATFLLVSVTFHPSILLVFPGWVLVVSTLLLVRLPGRSP